MAKKEKEETPNVNATANRDIAQRLNFLYQASVYLQSIAPSTTSGLHLNKGKQREESPDGNSTTSGSMVKKHRRKIGKKQTTGDLARSYVQSMRVVGQKTTVKIDPSLKRSLCSACSMTLIPGSSASIRVKKSPCHGQIVVYTCLNCKTTKRIPAPQSLNSGSAALDLNLSEEIASVPRDVNSQIQPISSGSQNQTDRPIVRTKKPRKCHSLPLSARQDAGHVVFRGNEKLDLGEGGFGVCFT
ncbi:hypothetical protein M413DRAFT_442165 [Hebeloma cylindrosporum]|uniref:Rpr2-domain-containing protein n=1 Tax=Hebeloma cylindrosporum TaxID=76867 RepID=A0A0C2YWX3_HEBCY|nr:hypothetical protein M413DRAFT_442165 [Hebeloma cylindrosporum h7]